MSITVSLSADEIEAIRAQKKEGGGYQSLFAKLEAGIDGDQLTTDDGTAERVIRYADDYGGGGWQDALKSIAAKLRSA